MTAQASKPRPYWHVDAKWVCGILAFFAIGITLLLGALTGLTRRDFAVTATATVIASLFSREGLDATEDVEAFRQQAAQTPGDIITPIADFPQLHISKADALRLSPRDLRIMIFSQLTTVVYDKGLEGAAEEFTNNPKDRERFVKQASVLGFFTQETHENVKSKLWMAALLALFLLVGVVYFSAGWGRMLSPGLLLLMASWPGAIFGLIFSYPPTNGDGPAGGLPPSIAKDLGTSLTRTYLTASLLGIALILAALIGKIVLPRLKRKQGSKPPKSHT